MKLATLRTEARDGALVVVDSARARYLPASDVAPNLQAALDDWDRCAPALAELAQALESGDVPGDVPGARPFDPAGCASPLPRAYQFLDGSAYVTHVELLRKSRGAELPESFWHDPLMYQGLSDGFLGPRDDIAVADEDFGIDFEAEVAVVLDDVPLGTPPARAGGHIKLVMLVNDVSLRGLIPGELAKGFGFLHGKPASAFSPLAVTPDALGAAWDGGKLHRPLVSQVNGHEIGRPDAGTDMTFDFPALIAHAAKTRALAAGTIVGSGTVSNAGGTAGSSCLAEVRMIEAIEHGTPKTPFLKFGDIVRIEMLDGDGATIFGAIEQKVVPG